MKRHCEENELRWSIELMKKKKDRRAFIVGEGGKGCSLERGEEKIR